MKSLIKMKNTNKAFTLIELLIVIAIIGILASVIFVSIKSARDKANIAKTVTIIKEIEKSILAYKLNTGQYPPRCSTYDNGCNSSNDPFINSLGVSGWGGPYYEIYSLTHAWGGGDIGIFPEGIDRNGNGTTDEMYILLDDDRPGGGPWDEGAQIPDNIMIEIDRILDDGDLHTGKVRGSDPLPPGVGTADNELYIMVPYPY